MRKIIAILTVITALIGLLLPSLAVNTQDDSYIKIYVDGVRIDSDNKPIIENSRTLAPIRPVAESAGITVGWDEEQYKVTLRHEFTTATLTIGSDTMTVYNSAIDSMETKTLDAVPKIVNSSTYITLRASLEAVGAGVMWKDEERAIYVVSPEEMRRLRISGELPEELAESGNASDDSGTSGTSDNSDNSEKDESPEDGDASADTDSDKDKGKLEKATLTYTGFREMENHEIVAHALHGLYGRILSDRPITLVRCRIVGTDMDAFLRFKAEDNITNYNVFTHFDKLMCFSDAGLGENTFEIYAATDGGEQQQVFSYKYTVLSDKTEADGNDGESNENAENTENNSDETNSEDSRSAQNGANAENGTDGTPEQDIETPVPLVSYYGFRKMPNDEIVEGAPHGLYGKVISNVPLLSVRCSIADTDMDYVTKLDAVNEIKEYDVFGYFDKLICFSDAGLGENTFEVYAAAEGMPESLLFSYNYTVISSEEKENRTREEQPEDDTSFDTELYGDVCLPLEGEIKLTSPYGFRAYNKWEFHKGIDIISSESLNIRSVADGVVVDCATGRNSGAGNYVAIQHEGGWVSLYYHLKSYDVEIGDEVEMGEIFAIMGNTGGNYGVHLHFMTCDNWYGSIWATQNSHHTAPHEYVPQILDSVKYYTPNYEKQNNDKIILCNFHFPSILEQGTAFSISAGKGFIALENTVAEVTLEVTDENGNVLIYETEQEPKYYSDGYYNYSNISVNLDKLCEFDKLPCGKMTLEISAATSNGRNRVLYTKAFEVVPTDGDGEQKTDAENPDSTANEETPKTDDGTGTSADGAEQSDSAADSNAATDNPEVGGNAENGTESAENTQNPEQTETSSEPSANADTTGVSSADETENGVNVESN